MSTLLLNLILLPLWLTSPSSSITPYELARCSSPCQEVRHRAYTLCYSEKHEQALWVAYSLTKEQAEGGSQRTNKFIEDPNVMTGSATNADYAHSGFDKGHLAPAADMAWSEETMAESFYLSNMSPQAPPFNRGIWKKLEKQVRVWAKENGKIYIATGPVLNSKLPAIGPNQVSVPKYFYKVILDYAEPELKAIGFIMPNEASSLPISHFAVTVDSVEKFTGIDFFYQLPEKIQEELESEVNPKRWTWQPSSNAIQKNAAKSEQCRALTKKGNRCSRKASTPGGFCSQHGRR